MYSRHIRIFKCLLFHLWIDMLNVAAHRFQFVLIKVQYLV